MIEARRVASTIQAVALVLLLVPLGIRLGEQHAMLAWEWSALFFAFPVAALVLAVLNRPQHAAWVLVVGTAAALFLLPLLAGAEFDQPPWMLGLYPVAATTTCLLSSRVWVNVVGLAALAAAVLLVELSWVYDAASRQVVKDLLYGVATAAAGHAILRTLVETERSVERAQTQAVGRFAEARAAEAVVRAAHQWDSFVHDEVLAALTVIGEGADPAEARSAAGAIVASARDLDVVEIPAPSVPEGAIESTLELAPDADTRFLVAADACEIPPHVRQAILEALSESLRNAVRHGGVGGRPPRMRVDIDHDADGILVRVSDDGVGFDRSAVGVSRLGILLSIEGRMDSVGGSARVRSAPGTGTEVEIRWAA
ncbi:MAG: hypothetical protein JWO46_2609 [Nocardioidaceae bacterium]|nr:hypothetical protein [Nocardioidaceae bacterium]